MKNLSNEEQITLILIGIYRYWFRFSDKSIYRYPHFITKFLKKSLDLYTFSFVALHRI